MKSEDLLRGAREMFRMTMLMSAAVRRICLMLFNFILIGHHQNMIKIIWSCIIYTVYWIYRQWTFFYRIWACGLTSPIWANIMIMTLSSSNTCRIVQSWIFAWGLATGQSPFRGRLIIYLSGLEAVHPLKGDFHEGQLDLGSGNAKSQDCNNRQANKN